MKHCDGVSKQQRSRWFEGEGERRRTKNPADAITAIKPVLDDGARRPEQ
jgi:hypothetical protein